ncbi:hypothetical protein R1sor_009654 [Riccia sorocarpa]|uniref:Uncharacterized protein n=1 Tax=Riccia sorocarpa TaxID=122646 RepID=A0ABD3HVU7_9MARC
MINGNEVHRGKWLARSGWPVGASRVVSWWVRQERRRHINRVLTKVIEFGTIRVKALRDQKLRSCQIGNALVAEGTYVEAKESSCNGTNIKLGDESDSSYEVEDPPDCLVFQAGESLIGCISDEVRNLQPGEATSLLWGCLRGSWSITLEFIRVYYCTYKDCQMQNSRSCAIAQHLWKAHEIDVGHKYLRKGGIEKYKAKAVPIPDMPKEDMMRRQNVVEWELLTTAQSPAGSESGEGVANGNMPVAVQVDSNAPAEAVADRNAENPIFAEDLLNLLNQHEGGADEDEYGCHVFQQYRPPLPESLFSRQQPRLVILARTSPHPKRILEWRTFHP